MELKPATELEILLTLLATQTALMHALTLSASTIPQKDSARQEVN